MSGDWVLGVGLAYSVYALTGSTLASSAALLSSFVPQVVVGSVAGVFVDRWDRKRTMVVANLALAVGLLPLLLVEGTEQIWLVYVVLAGESVVEVFFAPAEQALLPRVVPDEELVPANALNGQVRNLARLLGSGIGGVAAALGGITTVAVVDAFTFLVGAVLISRIRVSGRAERGPGRRRRRRWSASRLRTLADEWRTGLRATWHTPVVRALVIFTLITNTGEGIMGTLFAPYVRHVLHSGAGVYGVITGVQADRRDHRGLPGGGPGRALVAGGDARGGRGGLRARRPGDLPLPGALGLALAGRGGHGARGPARRGDGRRVPDPPAAPHPRRRTRSRDVVQPAGDVGECGGRLAWLPASSARRSGSCRSSRCRRVGYVLAGLLMLALLDRSAGRVPAAATLDLPGTRS